MITETKTKKSKKQDPFDSDISAVAAAVINKKRPSTEDLFEKARSLGIDPFETLLYIADGNKLMLSLDDENDKPITPELRAMAARECLKYLYPTMKATELTGANGGPVSMAVSVVFEDEPDEGDAE